VEPAISYRLNSEVSGRWPVRSSVAEPPLLPLPASAIAQGTFCGGVDDCKARTLTSSVTYIARHFITALLALSSRHLPLNTTTPTTMAPSVTLDTTPDFSMPSSTTNTTPRTLLLAPPSISSHPSALAHVASNHDRNATDIQMLDRLALGLVNLPAATYDVILLLTDVDGSRRESSRLVDRNVMGQLVAAMKVGGRLRAQDGGFGSMAGGAEHTEAILAGLVEGKGDDGMVKPDSLAGAQTVKLSFGGKKKANAVPLNGVEATPVGKRKSGDISTGNGSLASANGASVVQVTLAGVGFVDSNDDFDGGFDDGSGYDDDEDMEIPDDAELDRAERINPDSLLSEEDRQRPIIVRKLLLSRYP